MINLKDNCIYICVSNAKKGGFFSWMQRFITGVDATHSEPILHGELSKRVVGLSADKRCTLESIQDLIDNTEIDVWIYEIPTSLTYKEICEIEWDFTKENLTKRYGYLQILYFIPRRLAELVGWDIRRWRNPFPTGRLCSEICGKFFLRIKDILNIAFLEELKEWRMNNIHSGDILNLMNKYFKQNLIYDNK